MKNKIIILNGPPGSGKDVIAVELVKHLKGQQLEFKTALHNIAIAMTGLTREQYFTIYNDRPIKEIPNDALLGFSPRGLLIHISEVMCKPHFGKDYFGKLSSVDCARHIYSKDCVFSDGGFPDEVHVLADRFGKENIILVHLHRGETNFMLDSRDYIDIDGIKTTKVFNNFILKQAVEDILFYTNVVKRTVAGSKK